MLAAAPSANAATHSEIGVQSAGGCISAHGPGDWNKHCIDVVGKGVNVETVEGHLSSTVAPYFPRQICVVDVKIWGTELGGYYFERTKKNNGCGLGSLGVKWFLNMKFEPGSQICSQTTYEGRVPGPVCIQIRP
ncbi:hypothetical protein [Amycolatopsis anabasis]|uniref:hypothetical protein n=1 Tax=Amycolatopsis anabasis TaxID=1840409 RepID=UPI001C550BC7|nr:hypothetical protein [Amycolatopsis anabasis]